MDIGEVKRLQQLCVNEQIMVEVEETRRKPGVRCFLSAEENKPDEVMLYRHRTGPKTLIGIIDLNTQRGLDRLSELLLVDRKYDLTARGETQNQ